MSTQKRDKITLFAPNFVTPHEYDHVMILWGKQKDARFAATHPSALPYPKYDITIRGVSSEQKQEYRPTYRELWYDVGGTLLDIWEETTQLDAESLCALWNHLPVPRYIAERAINEYNQFFKTSYTLDQVNIPTLEALGYGRRFHVHKGAITMGVSWTWVKL